MRRTTSCITVVLLTLLIGLGTTVPAVAAVTWSTPAEIIASSVPASSPSQNLITATVQASTGTPYAAWLSQNTSEGPASNNLIRLAKFDGTAWSEITPSLTGALVASASGFTAGHDYFFIGPTYGLSLAVESNGDIDLAFVFEDGSVSPGSAQPRGIGYAKYSTTSSSWTTIEPVHTYLQASQNTEPTGPILALDASNPPNPLLVWEIDDVPTNSDKVLFASRATGSWSETTLGSFCRNNVWPDLTADASGHAHVTYPQGACTGTPTDLVYRTNASGSFSTPTVVSTGSATNQAQFPVIAIEPSGAVDIAYQEKNSSNLKFTSCTSSCTTTGSFATPTTVTTNGSPFNLRINSSNSKLIMYDNVSSNALASATQVGTNAWSNDTVDAAAGTTAYGAGVINDANLMVITYNHPSDNKAYYSHVNLPVPAVAPTVTSPTATSITTNSATLGGDVTSDGGSAITTRGVVAAVNSSNPNPTTTDSGVINLTTTGTTGVFTVNATNLTSGTTYAYRAYATNGVNTTYTTATTFTTQTTISSINRADTTPTNAASVSWTVTFANALSGLTGSNFTLVNTGLTGSPTISTVTASGGAAPQTTWTVTASTGTGSGTLGLNFTNGSTTTPAVSGTLTGQTYTIDHVAPTVQSINTSGANPTNANAVSWTVTFSEVVSGVASGNFTPAVTGLGGTPAVTTVTPSGSAPTATWTVSASSGSGSGTLGLNLTDGTGITDVVGNTLTGTPTTGAVYTIDHTSPAVQSINTSSSSPTNAATVSWTVTFSKAVSGVDMTNFTLTTTSLTGTPAVTGATPSGNAPTATWTVTASTGTGSGILRLDMANSTNVSDGVGNPVGGLPFTTGQAFAIDRTAPTTTITAKPNARTNQTSADFTFSATDPDDAANTLTFQCKLDSGQFARCTSPQHYAGPLPAGSHTFVVQAADPLINTETPGVNQTVTWIVDTTVPTAAIDSGPTQPGTTSTTATFTFHGSDPDGGADPLTFQCKLDSGALAACTSPTAAYTNLPDGAHTFTVQAMDSAGNLSTPATYAWTVASHPATIALGNPAGSPQQATVLTAFAQPLQVVVKNSLGQPLNGMVVTFTVTPAASGAAATLTAPAATDTNGLTSVVATANAVAGGPYTVTANVSPALGTPATFMLTNVAAVVTHLAIGTPNTALPPANVKVGENAMLTAMATFSNNTTGDVTASVTWTSSDPKIATVDASGKVTGVSPGTVTITATLNGLTQTIAITIPAPTPVGITVPTGRPSGTASETGGTPAPAPGGTASPAPGGPAPNPMPIGR